MNYKISIILPFFYSNTKKFDKNKNFSLLAFKKCLSAIFKSNYKNYEVIAISDNSSKESIDIAAKYPCKIIKSKKIMEQHFQEIKVHLLQMVKF